MRRATRWLLLLAAALVVYDLAQPPPQQVGARAAVWSIRRYQGWVSPVLARTGIACRFTPSCSRYAIVVIERDGLLRGSWRAARRIARCGPWTPAGTIDLP